MVPFLRTQTPACAELADAHRRRSAIAELGTRTDVAQRAVQVPLNREFSRLNKDPERSIYDWMTMANLLSTRAMTSATSYTCFRASRPRDTSRRARSA